jgi:hypothetical protein
MRKTGLTQARDAAGVFSHAAAILVWYPVRLALGVGTTRYHAGHDDLLLGTLGAAAEDRWGRHGLANGGRPPGYDLDSGSDGARRIVGCDGTFAKVYP